MIYTYTTEKQMSVNLIERSLSKSLTYDEEAPVTWLKLPMNFPIGFS